jgi:hypothetical protein
LHGHLYRNRTSRSGLCRYDDICRCCAAPIVGYGNGFPGSWIDLPPGVALRAAYDRRLLRGNEHVARGDGLIDSRPRVRAKR